MERTSTQIKMILALFAAVLILSALAAIGAVWIPQPELNPFATNGELIGYFFAMHSAGGLVAFIIVLVLVLADKGDGDSAPLTAAFLANLVPASVGLAVAGFFGNWGTVAIFVAAVALVGTLTFWLVVRAFGRALRREHP
ncbi:hypothetical protein [Microbacterium oleivorans]|uniref:hypothetical protein n=1 Tax=Microbacterium oleivorans TaxID=273677 RepID=UPI00203B81A1|nr:hypothetical protein [Microbacterium oleivorans]MCM3696538.1 hypothetical protein [Microbacterium oleivorans]